MIYGCIATKAANSYEMSQIALLKSLFQMNMLI